VNEIRQWAVEMEWSAKEVSKAMEDSAIGNYTAPGLLLQKEFTKVLLEPIARSAPGAEGVVDLSTGRKEAKRGNLCGVSSPGTELTARRDNHAFPLAERYGISPPGA
jgi:hypothetical protein